jgi:hypothetical protein
MSKGFSVTCRFAFTGTIGGYERIIEFTSGLNENTILIARTTSSAGAGSGVTCGYRLNNGTQYLLVADSPVFAQDTINNIAVVYNPPELSIYVNGVLANTRNDSGAYATDIRTLTNCFVGRGYAESYKLSADIYSLNIYNRVLNPNEFKQPSVQIPWGIFTSTPNGLTANQPATNALALRQGYPGYNDGVYWINCGGVPTQTYCLMNPKWDGGGWMLIMKAAQGSTFNWGATYWTTTNTLNPSDTTTTVADAKFDVFNYVPVTDVMAVWPSSDVGAGNTGGSLAVTDGWVWLVNKWNTTAITPLAGFQIDRPAIPPDIFNFSGFSKTSPIWSYQSGTRAHVFGSGAHVPSAPGSDVYFTRWGFMWNNESGTTHTQDAFAGIGLNIPSSSGGDFNFWVGTDKKGFNRNIAWLMYGR